MREPFFSIIIPCLNEEETLPHLFLDLEAQSLQDFEFIVVDGNSEDKTREIAKKFSKTLNGTLIVSDRRNVGYQRNLGAIKAKGRYLIFFDADVHIEPEFLSGIQYFLIRDKIDSCTAWIQTDGKHPSDKLFASFYNTVSDTMAAMSLPIAYGAFICAKKQVFTKIKGFDSKIVHAEDIDFVRRVVDKNFKFAVLHEPLYTYSLRRYRKEGTLRLLRKLAPLSPQLLMNKKITKPLEAYPMLGGKYFSENGNKKSTMSSLETLVQALKFILGEKKN